MGPGPSRLSRKPKGLVELVGRYSNPPNTSKSSHLFSMKYIAYRRQNAPQGATGPRSRTPTHSRNHPADRGRLPRWRHLERPDDREGGGTKDERDDMGSCGRPAEHTGRECKATENASCHDQSGQERHQCPAPRLDSTQQSCWQIRRGGNNTPTPTC